MDAQISLDVLMQQFFNVIPQPADNKKKFPYGSLNSSRPVTPPRGANTKNKKK